VATLSFKDRSAVLTAGHAADLALFFDARAGALHTTSTALRAERRGPRVVARYQAAVRGEPPRPWLPEEPRASRTLGPDDAPARRAASRAPPPSPTTPAPRPILRRAPLHAHRERAATSTSRSPRSKSSPSGADGCPTSLW